MVEDGVSYCVWAPNSKRVIVEIQTPAGTCRDLELSRDKEGYHRGVDVEGKAGDAYFYRLESLRVFPDPVSRAQQSDVHGRSLVVDPWAYQWKDTNWKRPLFRDLIIYELHVGTFTPAGTFRAISSKLKYLQNLGITAIELMPVADFPGQHNWGYDGVLIYAPAHCYGAPDDLRSFVDDAHAHGISVILDVVYNHFGPAGNYLSQFSSHYFNSHHQTPWGDAFNFDGDMSEPVREFFGRNPLYWMEEFHIDGFRFDATHAIKDDSQLHILAEITQEVHALGGYIIAEDSRNEVKLITPRKESGFGMDAVWADDFHHSARVSQITGRSGYFQDFEGSPAEMTSILQNGWLYCGEISKYSGLRRGTKCGHIPPERFIHCISNHDQIGNRAKGERLHHLISPAGYRALSMLLCLSPFTPLFFMGQEWGASTPFLYFTDHETELGKKVTEGRYEEFADFPEFQGEAKNGIPDPQAIETFENSKLDWSEINSFPHQELFRLYRDCLNLRQEIATLKPLSRKGWHATQLSWEVGAVKFDAHYMIVYDLLGDHSGFLESSGCWKAVLTSGDAIYGGNQEVQFDNTTQKLTFKKPGVVFLKNRKALS